MLRSHTQHRLRAGAQRHEVPRLRRARARQRRGIRSGHTSLICAPLMLEVVLGHDEHGALISCVRSVMKYDALVRNDEEE